jgi:CHAT domain-containing protein
VRLGAALLPASVRERVRAARRVHVIPDGALHGFPFEALVLEETDGRPVYWLEDGPEICYGHSLATLAEILARGDAPAATRAVVTVNDPSYGDAGGANAASATPSLDPSRRWPPLPGTRDEGEALLNAFAGSELVDLTAGQAREAEVKRVVPRARLLHFGTHGIVEQERSDLLAALVLAEEPAGSAEDGFLHLFEVYELGLDADLVVLSACETTLGRRVRGEGVFALSRGFLAAGSRRVVASLWSVDDEATAELMSEFFAELGGGADAATALTRAKRTLRGGKKWKDPFFWAPFVLSGRF